ncbi:plasmid pRiA4b ORF-3 family protein [bacterium]|nr:plasmid pRiA4b ORF-3 family protein [bacterium]
MTNEIKTAIIKLEELFHSILNDPKEDSRVASLAVRKYLYNSQEGVEKFKEIKKVLDTAPAVYAKITDDFRKEYFVRAVSTLYFLHDLENESDFLFPWLFELIQNPNGNIRYAAVRMFVTTLGPLTYFRRFPDHHKTEENSVIKAKALKPEKTEQILIALTLRLWEIANDTRKLAYKKVRYVQDLPSSIHKSVQLVIATIEDYSIPNHIMEVEDIKPKQTEVVDKVVQFKVTLNAMKPACWRRIVVPEDYSFGELSLAILDAFERIMGYHLHGYSISTTPDNGRFIHIGIPIDDDDTLDEAKEKIADYFGKVTKQCIFTYDFGDGWDHTVLYEGTFKAEKNTTYPQCITGKGATPPEDTGGVWGFQDKLKIIKNSKHPEYKECREWFGLEEDEEYNHEFNLSDIEMQDRQEYQAIRKEMVNFA